MAQAPNNNNPAAPAADDAGADQRLKEANVMIGAGTGVAALGVGGAILAGAVCPLCYFVPPLLIGAGLVQRHRAKKKKTAA